jgi:ribosomal subunit interface protein
MQANVFVRGVDQPDEIRAFATKKINTGLRRYSKAIRSAKVRLVDETGPRKQTKDKVCAIELDVRGGAIRIREVSGDFRVSINVALDRARAALSRHVSRKKRGVGEG